MSAPLTAALPAVRFVCFGEVLLRLSSPAGQLPLQSPGFEVCVGGAEANVAVSLARFGHDTRLVSVLPDNALGRAARDTLRGHGVDTRAVRFDSGRMGLYFLTPGAVLRPSEVIYDRAGSAFALAEAAGYDWPALLDGAGWLHISGVSPALGAGTARAVLDAARAARAAGVQVSFDGNYRATLWAQWGRNGNNVEDGAAILHELMSEVDLAFADQRDIALVLRRPELADGARRDEAMAAAFAAYPHLRRIAATRRVQHGVGRHDLSATLHTRAGALAATAFEMDGIVDRIGAGDAFAAGVLHGLARAWDDARALEFGLAAACLKHSIAGDFNLAGEAEVERARQGGLDVRR
jgi:2-dehydro-3-deoxygluconokinase